MEVNRIMISIVLVCAFTLIVYLTKRIQKVEEEAIDSLKETIDV